MTAGATTIRSMTSPDLESFIAEAAARSREQAEPADCVLALAPLMLDADRPGRYVPGAAALPKRPPRATRATSSTRHRMPASRSTRSSGCRASGRRCTTTAAGGWSASSKACSKSAATCGCRRTAAPTKSIDLARGGTGAAAARRGDELRAEPGPHPRHRGADGTAPRGQPAPLRPDDERLQHLRLDSRSRRRISVAHNES